MKTADDYHEKTVRENADSMVLHSEQTMDLGGEWFDGVSGTNSQSRYMSREEILKRIEDRKMKRIMQAALEKIEQEEQDDRIAAFRAEVHGEHAGDVAN